MAVLEIPSISKEYVPVPITKAPAGVTDLDVKMAILPAGQDPTSSDWAEAEWAAGSNTAVILIGPGTDYELSKGQTYGVWVQIIAPPEEPVLGPYPLHIT